MKHTTCMEYELRKYIPLPWMTKYKNGQDQIYQEVVACRRQVILVGSVPMVMLDSTSIHYIHNKTTTMGDVAIALWCLQHLQDRRCNLMANCNYRPTFRCYHRSSKILGKPAFRVGQHIRKTDHARPCLHPTHELN